MKKIKKINIALTSTLAISFSLLPIATLSSINFINSTKALVENPGFNIQTPDFINSQQFDESKIINNQFIPTIEASTLNSNELNLSVGLDGKAKAERKVSDLSKNFIWTDGQFNVNFYKTFLSKEDDISPSEPESIIATGTNSVFIDQGVNVYKRELLMNGTGQPNGIFTKIHQGVLAAEFIDGKLWLVTSGNFGNGVTHMLQIFNISTSNGVPNITFIASNRLNFTGSTPASLIANPPVISPVYEIINGKFQKKPKEVIIWQQNNSLNSLNAKTFTLNGIVLTETQTNIGTIQGNPSILAITPLIINTKRYYYVHSTINNVLSLSKSESSSAPTETIILSNNKSIDNIDVKNEMPYAMLVGDSSNFEILWIFVKNNESQIFSTTVENNSINKAKSSAHDLGNRNIGQVQYMDIKSNGKNYLSLKLNNPNPDNSNLLVSSLVNLNELKEGKTFQEANNDILLENITSDVNINTLQNNAHIFSLDKGIINYSYEEVNEQYQQPRYLEDISNLLFETITPNTIVVPSPVTSSTTDPELSQNIINATKNLVSIENITSDIIIHDKLFTPNNPEVPKGHGSFELIYSYGRGSFNNQGNFLSPPNPSLYEKGPEGELGKIPPVNDGVSPFKIASIIQQPEEFIPLKVSINLPSDHSKLVPSKFVNHLTSILGNGILPPNFENDPKYNDLIGSKSTDLIQITNAYLPLLSNVNIEIDDFLGKINFRTNFNNDNAEGGQTPLLVSADGFFGNIFYIYTIIPSVIAIAVIILIIIFIASKRKKNKDMIAALSSGFKLSQKLSKDKLERPIKYLNNKNQPEQPLSQVSSPKNISNVEQPLNDVKSLNNTDSQNIRRPNNPITNSQNNKVPAKK